MSDPTPWFARSFDAAYLEIYAHRDATEAVRGTAALLEPLGLTGRRVLDVGCGAGRWTLAVAARGAEAVGLDLSADLLAAARRAGVERLVRGDMRWLPFAPAAFDLVLCMFTTFGYFATPGEDRAAIAEMARVVRPDGAILLDLLNPATARRTLVPESVRDAGRFTVHERRRLEDGGERIVKEIELQAGGDTRRYREEIRLWTREALVAACRTAGLEPVTTWGDYDAAAYDASHSSRLLQLLRRSA